MRLLREATTHRAVRHPYLQAMAEGTLPDPRWALADFAQHYIGYSTHFPRYLATVISRLEDARHRQALLDNLSEESGRYTEHDLELLERTGIQRDWVESITHPRLFQRFAAALGVEPSVETADEVVCWRDLLLAVLTTGSPAEAVGALGLGTEAIVRPMYGYFVRAIERFTTVTPRDCVFFQLHTIVDDQHMETLLGIAEHYADSEGAGAQLRRGMLKALGLRSLFWDWLHERALDPRAHGADA